MTKTIDGIVLYRRPPSSSCPKGAWSTDRYHTHWSGRGWVVYQTGLGLVTVSRTAKEARQVIALLENEERGLL